MPNRFAFATLLFMTLPAHAAAAPSCSALEAVPAAVAQAPFLVLGDVHGTREVPAFVAAYLCAAAQQGRKTTLAIEFPANAQDTLDAFMASQGTPQDVERLTSGGIWRNPRQDGRTSIDTLRMLQRIRALRAGGADIRVAAIDTEAAAPQRSAAMAERLRAELREKAGRQVVALVGALHAVRTKGNRFNPNHESAIYLLADQRPLALTVGTAGGSAWVCKGPMPASCGVTAWDINRVDPAPPAPFSLVPPSPQFDGVFYVGATTASPPAVSGQTPALQWATADAFARPHQLVDIGGRKMHLYCSGQGATTVVFDAPSGQAGWNWFQVQPAVARHTRACVFDRAGLGFSDPATRPNTAENVTEDLHKLLAGAGVKPPYVMVGNSMGGANVQVYAYRYPSEVKGLVLVEPQHEDGTSRLDKASQGNLKKLFAMVAQQNDYCMAAAQKGMKPGSEEQRNCTGNPTEEYGPTLGATVMSATTGAAYWRANLAESDAIALSDEQLRKLRRPFGDLPVVVLTRGVSPYAVPGKPQSAVNKAVEDENLAIQKETAALSTRGTQRVVPGAGHVIHADQPQAVVDAVLEVLNQVK